MDKSLGDDGSKYKWITVVIRHVRSGASFDDLVTHAYVDTCCQGCIEFKYPNRINKVITVEMSPMEIAER